VPGLLTGDWTPSSGYAAGKRLAARVRSGDGVTAIFLANDQMALGLLAALHEEGLEVPGDVSVVGFDDLPEAPYFTPPLTTVRQDFAELGRRGVQLVLARLQGTDLYPDPVPPTLVVRASTGPSRVLRAGSARPGSS
jgi:DNA-binding LacI/PurR family transcriptional regulator